MPDPTHHGQRAEDELGEADALCSLLTTAQADTRIQTRVAVHLFRALVHALHDVAQAIDAHHERG